jgi:hypothetical protein
VKQGRETPQFEQGDRLRQARGAQVEQVVVALLDSYGEAERAVDYLSDKHFPVRHTAIVGRGLSNVEQVTGRLTGG